MMCATDAATAIDIATAAAVALIVSNVSTVVGMKRTATEVTTTTAGSTRRRWMEKERHQRPLPTHCRLCYDDRSVAGDSIVSTTSLGVHHCWPRMHLDFHFLMRRRRCVYATRLRSRWAHQDSQGVLVTACHVTGPATRPQLRFPDSWCCDIG